MNYIITENQLKKLLEEGKEPSMPIIIKLFKMLNEEKKKNKSFETYYIYLRFYRNRCSVFFTALHVALANAPAL